MQNLSYTVVISVLILLLLRIYVPTIPSTFNLFLENKNSVIFCRFIEDFYVCTF